MCPRASLACHSVVTGGGISVKMELTLPAGNPERICKGRSEIFLSEEVRDGEGNSIVADAVQKKHC